MSVEGRLGPRNVLVTTTPKPSDAAARAAEKMAAAIGAMLVRRGKHSVIGLVREAGLDGAVVVDEGEARLMVEGATFSFHPNMARPRIRELRKGRKDRLAEVMGLRPGDRVLDCTCGLASDAIVAAHLVGPEGRCRGIEASAILAAIVGHGLARYEHVEENLVAAMRRLELTAGDYRAVVPTLDPESWDVVYFDPMFPHTLSDSSGLDVVRLLAHSEAPTREDVQAALRVARRCVVIKDQAPGRLLHALGVPMVSDKRPVCYGRVGT